MSRITAENQPNQTKCRTRNFFPRTACSAINLLCIPIEAGDGRAPQVFSAEALRARASVQVSPASGKSPLFGKQETCPSMQRIVGSPSRQCHIHVNASAPSVDVASLHIPPDLPSKSVFPLHNTPSSSHQNLLPRNVSGDRYHDPNDASKQERPMNSQIQCARRHR